MKKFFMSILLVCLLPVIAHSASTAFKWTSYSLDTNYTAMVLPDGACRDIMIYNTTGISYYLAEDSAGTNAVEISADDISFSLDGICPVGSTNRVVYIALTSTSGTVVLFYKTPRQ